MLYTAVTTALTIALTIVFTGTGIMVGVTCIGCTLRTWDAIWANVCQVCMVLWSTILILGGLFVVMGLLVKILS